VSTTRISKIAAPGSLFKSGKPHRKLKATGREPRERDEAHLDAIRQCPCIRCGIDPAGEAAHLRLTAPGKPNAGIGSKPHDRYVLPLCREDHDEQHRIGEVKFWKDVGIDPLVMAERLYRVSPNTEAMRSLVWAAQAIAGAE